MSTFDDPAHGDEQTRFEAEASDGARIYQAGRDQYVAERDLHLHYRTGVRRARGALGDMSAVECPYPGLAAFDEEQSSWFFGRDAVTADLLVRLDARLRGGGALAVVAPSGAGKSSVLRAGLLPALARGALPAVGSGSWPRVLLTPTAYPVAALFAHLSHALGADPRHLHAALRVGPQACVAALHAATEAGPPSGRDSGKGRPSGRGRRLVLVVDQLEEMFTLCGDERERQAFLDVLSGLARPRPDGRGPVALVVLGLRSDFYSPCADYPQLRSALQDGQLVIGSMTRAELEEAITLPANAVGLDVEPGLTELLLRDLGAHTGHYEAGRLPLLGHALRATWQQRHGHVLTVEGYRATGGIRNAVTTTADTIYRALQPDEQRIARSLFLRLVRIGDGVEDTRRRLPRAELLTTGPDPRAAATVIAVFTQGRLLTQHQDTVEITHEALLQAWPRLREWIQADRAGHLLHQDLEEAAAAWERSGRDTGMLYRGQRLETARAWAEQSAHEQLGPAAATFLATSVQHGRRGIRLRRTAVAALTALAVIASAAAGLALQQRSEAQAQRDEAVFSRIKAESDGLRENQASLAAQLNLSALALRPDDPDLRTRLIEDASRPLSRPLTGGGSGPFGSLAFSQDGSLLAAGSDHGSVQLWRFSESGGAEPVGRVASDSDEGPVYDVALHQGRKLMATANNDERVRLFDLADPARPRLLGDVDATGEDDARAALTVSFSPDGKTMATAANGERAQMWDITDPLRPRRQGLTPAASAFWGITTVVFSPSGRYLAGAGDDGSAQLWDVRDPAKPVSLGSTEGIPETDVLDWEGGVAFSPDEATLATGGSDGFVRLWDITDKRRLKLLGKPLPHEFSAVTDVAFSADGRTLASTSAFEAVCVWNLADVTDVPLMKPLRGHLIGARALAFRPSDDTLVSAGADAAPLVWDLRRTVLNQDSGVMLAKAFRPDRTMVTVNDDGAVRRWSLQDVGRPALLESGWFGRATSRTTIEEWPATVTLSPDGETMALYRETTGIELWDITDVRRPRHILVVPKTNREYFSTLAFSPDGHVLAASDQFTPWLWDVTDPARPKPLHRVPRSPEEPFRLDVLAYSPDGRRLLGLYSAPKQVHVWDVTDPARPRLDGRTEELPLNGVHALTMAVSPKGHLLAVGSDEGRIHLWSLTGSGPPSPRGTVLVPTGATHSLSFSPDERLLVSGHEDGFLRLWDVSAEPKAFGRPLTGHTRAVDTVAFVPNAPLIVSDGFDGTVRLWPTETSYDIGLVCAASSGTLTRAEWGEHVSGLPYDPPCDGRSG
ncbi:NACHT and WD repeat domain-containing protein [Streptomyces sp. NPDC001658]